MIVFTANIKEHSNWSSVEEVIKNIDKKGIFVSFCDSYFVNNTNSINELWYGIIHNPFNWEKYSLWDNNISLFDINSFITSLKFCKILFVMNETQITHTKQLLKSKGFDNIIVASLIHPINELTYEFNYDEYISNKNKTIYSIGN